METEEAQSLLERSWYSLNCSAKFDLVIIFFTSLPFTSLRPSLGKFPEGREAAAGQSIDPQAVGSPLILARPPNFVVPSPLLPPHRPLNYRHERG
ncbi:hypothetical protein MLD38_002166 [Melastoma candidum]|uniref:Uncharacterized protein n=1 Tax=Melastoma candidum TaxID=119954 RepID=A0ACB9SP64_9MYRT|nr:hypothetical protein MLD38_002166 [Melastoma candidum]